MGRREAEEAKTEKQENSE